MLALVFSFLQRAEHRRLKRACKSLAAAGNRPDSWSFTDSIYNLVSFARIQRGLFLIILASTALWTVRRALRFQRGREANCRRAAEPVLAVGCRSSTDVRAAWDGARALDTAAAPRSVRSQLEGSQRRNATKDVAEHLAVVVVV